MPSAIGVAGIDVTRVDTAQLHELGLEVAFNDGSHRRYIKAGAAIAQYDALTADAAEGIYNLHPTSAVAQPVAGIAQVAIADDKYGWVTTRGTATVKVAATVVAGAHLASSAVAGTLDDVTAAAADAQAAAAGIGITVITDDAPSAGLALVSLN